MSQIGFFKYLKNLFRLSRTYGDKELAQLKASAEELKSQVDLLLEAQKTRRRQEELLVLREVRKTVEALRAEDQAIQQQGRAVEEAINVVASNAEDEFANQAQLKAHEHLETILKAVDVDKFLQGAPLKESLRPGHGLPEKLKEAIKRQEDDA